MQKELIILVLGIGGNVGQGILKALQISQIPHRVIGACISPLAYGLYTTHRSYVSPYYNDPNFLEWIVKICKDEKVDVILTGVEQVLFFLSKHADEIKHRCGALSLVSESAILAITQDKYLTCQWLEKNGFNYPHYALSTDAPAVKKLIQNHSFPLIAKPRAGRGGAGVIKVSDSNTLEFICKQTDYVLQEYIGHSQAEYTVGCFSNQEGAVSGSIVMKRELLEGTTFRAEVVDHPVLQAEAVRIVTALKPKGPCNLQFRLNSEDNPVCFEINMRFSGTTPIRARFGFNEVKAALEHYVLGKKNIEFPHVTQGIALRYWNEVYVDSDAYKELQKNEKLSDPKQFDLLVEDYGMSSL